METIDELTAFLATATVDGILGRLLYRGAAWSLMREEGVLPANAPPLGATIETDLAEHGFALLRGAMALRTQAGASPLTGKAFERAANAFEALVRNGDPESPDRGFRRTIAAAAYHLAGFSAVAYSLFNETAGDLNASPGERAIQHLILRDLGQLRGYVRDWLADEAHGDEQIAAAPLSGSLPLGWPSSPIGRTKYSAGSSRPLAIEGVERLPCCNPRRPGFVSSSRVASTVRPRAASTSISGPSASRPIGRSVRESRCLAA